MSRYVTLSFRTTYFTNEFCCPTFRKSVKHLIPDVSRIEKRVDIAWKSEGVQLPDPSPSLSAVLQPASKAPPRCITQSNSFLLACFQLVFVV